MELSDKIMSTWNRKSKETFPILYEEIRLSYTHPNPRVSHVFTRKTPSALEVSEKMKGGSHSFAYTVEKGWRYQALTQAEEMF